MLGDVDHSLHEQLGSLYLLPDVLTPRSKHCRSLRIINRLLYILIHLLIKFPHWHQTDQELRKPVNKAVSNLIQFVLGISLLVQIDICFVVFLVTEMTQRIRPFHEQVQFFGLEVHLLQKDAAHIVNVQQVEQSLSSLLNCLFSLLQSSVGYFVLCIDAIESINYLEHLPISHQVALLLIVIWTHVRVHMLLRPYASTDKTKFCFASACYFIATA